jgi:hypothetical protein
MDPIQQIFLCQNARQLPLSESTIEILANGLAESQGADFDNFTTVDSGTDPLKRKGIVQLWSTDYQWKPTASTSPLNNTSEEEVWWGYRYQRGYKIKLMKYRFNQDWQMLKEEAVAGDDKIWDELQGLGRYFVE